MPASLIHSTTRKLLPGQTQALGATLMPGGVNFAIYSKYARDIFLQLFAPGKSSPSDTIKLERSQDDIWSVFVKDLKPGQLYGYKVNGDYNPREGMRFNPNKLLLDPYAKSFQGDFKNTDHLLFAYDAQSVQRDLSFDDRDNTAMAPKSVVVKDDFDWKGTSRPGIPLEKLIIYEVHLKGFTAHPSSGVKHPGTYLGFIEKIPYLKQLGINAVEFLPVHQFYKRDGLVKLGLTDYWGYNSVGFFAPENSYASAPGGQVAEFKSLVKELHKAGIEVIIDVVYNHTGEGDEIGPTLAFRGIDNSAYYALKGVPGEPYRYYANDAGTGNMLNVEQPMVRRLVLDSLRYWAEVMHVDGFRFDLATILGRVHCQFSRDSQFFQALSQDPVLKDIKLIAEPWDLASYEAGKFPLNWSEWNGKFRDNARRFILGHANQARESCVRLTGSADLYGDDGRTPYNSINFITCHDGFTLNDLFSYGTKHNEANGEGNRDGTNENFSWNCGVEGPTQDEAVLKLRKQMIKNALAYLLIPLGTPMVLGGDEFMRTQRGNNNGYCQDNDISWFDWDYARAHSDITEFLIKTIGFRKGHPVLQQRKVQAGQVDHSRMEGISWYGMSLDPVKWDDPELRTFCAELKGPQDPITGAPYYLLFILNADWNPHTIKIPQYPGIKWYRAIDTSLKSGEDILVCGQEQELGSPDAYPINSRCLAALIGRG